MKEIILYNPCAGGGACEKTVRSSRLLLNHSEEPIFRDIREIVSYEDFYSTLENDDILVLCGGDGTLNRFINATAGLTCPCALYYFASGSGNDFMREVGNLSGNCMIRLEPYIQSLPTVEVEGRSYRFLNNVGFGIDGYCTWEGDRQRSAGRKNVNYTAIAIKGLLGAFHPVNARISVDGVEHSYENVWLSPTMNGLYYGGGMSPTPEQNRLNRDGTVSLMVMHGKSRLKTLACFPGIFTGKHVKHKDMVEIFSGSRISVEFDRPTPLQIDGETIPGVRSYTVCAGSHSAAPSAAANIKQGGFAREHISETGHCDFTEFAESVSTGVNSADSAVL